MLSRFLPPAIGSPSVYETLRQHDESSDQSDIEERAGMTIDEENLGVGFQDYELEEALADVAASQITAANAGHSNRKVKEPLRRPARDKTWLQNSPKIPETDDLDDEVPQSLLIEGDQDGLAAPKQQQQSRGTVPLPVPGPTNKASRAKWQTTQDQLRLHQDIRPTQTQRRSSARRTQVFGMIDPKERAMWRWANVANLDNFLKDVYDYFLGNGIWCILMSRVLNLL